MCKVGSEFTGDPLTRPGLSPGSESPHHAVIHLDCKHGHFGALQRSKCTARRFCCPADHAVGQTWCCNGQFENIARKILAAAIELERRPTPGARSGGAETDTGGSIPPRYTGMKTA